MTQNISIKEASAKDYSYLLDKEIIYFTGAREIPAIVANIDYHIGITIVAKEDKNLYLSCLLGPMAPNIKYPVPAKTYNKDFLHEVAEIEAGYMAAGSNNPSERKPSAEFCPFNQ